MSQNISILLLGDELFSILPNIINYKEDHKYHIICSNLLDFELLPKQDNTRNRVYRDELRRIYRLLKTTSHENSSVQLDILRKNDYMGLDDVDLEINDYIFQVFNNKEDIQAAYNFLENDINLSNVEIHPLINNRMELNLVKSHKYAPLRYYARKREMLQIDEIKELINDPSPPSELTLMNHDLLKDQQVAEETTEILEKSDIFVIFASDLISLAVLSQTSKILELFRAIDCPILMIWGDQTKFERTFADNDIFELLGLGSTNDKLIDIFANTVDYILTSNKESDDLNSIILESGYKVDKNNLSDPLEDDTDLIGIIERIIETE